MTKVTPQELKNVPLFAGIPSGRLAAIAGALNLETVPEGAVLLRQGESSGRVYIVLSGVVRIGLKTSDGGDSVINTVWPGGILGEIDAYEHGGHTAGARMYTNGCVLWIQGAKFVEAIDACPELAANYHRLISRRQRRLTALQAKKLRASVRVRLAAQIADLALSANGGPGNVVPPRFEVPVHIPDNDICSMIDASRSAVSKEMGMLRVMGLIEETGKGHIVVPDFERLDTFRD